MITRKVYIAIQARTTRLNSRQLDQRRTQAGSVLTLVDHSNLATGMDIVADETISGLFCAVSALSSTHFVTDCGCARKDTLRSP